MDDTADLCEGFSVWLRPVTTALTRTVPVQWQKDHSALQDIASDSAVCAG